MVTLEQHLAQADRNERLANIIAALPERFTEWEVTLLFYSALHYVDAFLATQERSPKRHRDRNNLVASLTNLGREYQNLFQQSMNSRYHLYTFTPQEVSEIKAEDFDRVKEEVLSLLSSETVDM